MKFSIKKSNRSSLSENLFYSHYFLKNVEKSSSENFKLIKNTLPNKSGNPESLKKIITTAEKLSHLRAEKWRGFAEVLICWGFIHSFVFQMISERANILLAIWEAFFNNNDSDLIPSNVVTNLFLSLSSCRKNQK